MELLVDIPNGGIGMSPNGFITYKSPTRTLLVMEGQGYGAFSSLRWEMKSDSLDFKGPIT